MKTRIVTVTLAACAMVFTGAQRAVAQEDLQGQAKQPKSGSMDMSKMMHGSAKEEPMTEAKMMQQCQDMKAQKKRMKEDMQAQDAQLTGQLAEMNRAPRDKKVGLMAAALTNMVEQRIAMDARKAKMEEEMMKHMMQHMQMGKESMSQCPMMKEMKDMDEKSTSAHKDH